MKKSIYKIKMNYNAEEGRQVPWELIYLLKKPAEGTDEPTEEQLSSILFKRFLLVRDSEAIIKTLSRCSVHFFEDIQPRRDDSSKEEFPKNDTKEISELLPEDLSEYTLVIPLLARKTRLSTTSQEYQLRLTYIASKSFQDKLKSDVKKPWRHYNKTKLPKVTLCLRGKQSMHPCALCSNFPHKVIDVNACDLGSFECIQKILIPQDQDQDQAMEVNHV